MKDAFYFTSTQCCPHIKTSQLICCANQLTGFYMKATLAFNGLKALFVLQIFKFLSRPFQFVYCNCVFSRLWRHEFWNLPQLSYQAVLVHNQKSQGKTLISQEQALFIILKVVSLKKIKRIYLWGGSPTLVFRVLTLNVPIPDKVKKLS